MGRKGWVVVGLVALVLLIALGASLLSPMGWGSRYGYGYGGMMGPWMMGGYGIFWMLGGVLLLVLLVGGAVWLFQSAMQDRGARTGPPGETPLEILRRRYASGELTKEQFEAMRRDLGG